MSDLYPETIVDEVLARTDIRSVVEPYVHLTRKGGRHFGLCPFHQEKTPSFSVSPERGLFYCFGCGAGGSALQFLMKLEGWSFAETLKELARRAGVTLPQPSERIRRDQEQRKSEQDAYFSLTEAATLYFMTQLASGRFPQANRYLSDRGVDGRMAQVFRLGYAPPGWDNLLRGLRRNNTPEHSVEAAGLAIRRKGSGFYDRFRDRIMFPVIDSHQHVVGFSGRALGVVEEQKYVNSPELPFFKKGEHLFGIHAAKEAFRKEGQAILVEGNFDVVTLHAAGLDNAVAPLGTALTEPQVRLLRRLVDRAVLVFDGDEAGRRAMVRGMEPCYRTGIDVRAALLPPGSDPDSFVRERGGDAFRELIGHARPLAEVALDQVVAPAVGGALEERVRAGRLAAEVLEQVGTGTLHRGYIEEVARRLDLKPEDLTTRPERGEKARPAATQQPVHLSDNDSLLVQLVADAPHLVERLVEQEPVLTRVHPAVRHFARLLWRAYAASPDTVRVDRLVEQLEESWQGPILEAVSSPRVYPEGQAELALDKQLRKLQVDHLHLAKQKLAEQMRQAENTGDEPLFATLAEQDRSLTKELQALQRYPLAL